MQIGGMQADQVDLNHPSHHTKAWALTSWNYTTQAQRMRVLRHISTVAGRNPKLATFVVDILRKNQIQPRDYIGQARTLFEWVQNNIYYVNEPAERLQDPLYTLRVGYGDCDDMVLLLNAMFESINLKWKMVLVGKHKSGVFKRWIEGSREDRSVPYQHIYCMVGNNPYKPTRWYFCEPTMKVPFGWDVVDRKNIKAQSSSNKMLPELSDAYIEVGEDDQPKEKAEILKKIYAELKPSKLIPLVIVSAVTGVLVSVVTERYVLPALGMKKRRK